MIAPIHLQKFRRSDSSIGTKSPLSKALGLSPKPLIKEQDGALALAFTSLPLWRGVDVTRN